jgi:tRNA threonylcarbamoyl adenosine modification protein (Sua5/YciO/YrdC/YwlC family)
MDAVAALRAGRPVILPTDTVYGIASRADDEAAVHELSRLKGRDVAQPIALVAASLDVLFAALPELDARGRAIAAALLPGPYTLVLPNPARRFPWLAGSNPETLGVRVPDWPEAGARVLAAVGVVAATSANLTGGADSARVADVPQELLDACAAVVDAGDLRGTASTVIDFTGEEPRVLREGAAPSAEAIERALGAT